MQFQDIGLDGAFVITLKKMEDDRGFFARSFCKIQLQNQGLHGDFVQCNISYNHREGTIRGLHYQSQPHSEVKIVYCIRGAIFDVIVDIRKNSKTFGKWVSIELTSENYKALYIPKGFAHGFQTLCAKTEVFYLMGDYYYPSFGKGICWNDPFLAINWPRNNIIISEKDKQLPRFE